MTEHEIRSLLSQSPADGHRKLFEQYSSYVYAIVWRILGNIARPEDVDECVSDVFTEIFSNLDAIYEGSMKGYIGTLARRMAVTQFRRFSSSSGRTIPLDEEIIGELASDTDIVQDYEKSAQAKHC